jgi:hypothetical protein
LRIINLLSQVQLSDGEHTLFATLAPRIKTSSRTRGIAINTVIKVLQFDRRLWSSGENYNQVYIHLTKISVISGDPGHKFGSPVYFYDVCDDDDDDDNSTIDDEDAQSTSSSFSSNDDRRTAAVIVSGLVPNQQQHARGINPIILPRAEHDAIRADGSDSSNDTQALQQLYRLSYRVSDNPLNSKIPTTDLEIDTHGIGPGPKCRWIPAADDVSTTTQKGNNATAIEDKKKRTMALPTRTSSFNEFAASVLPLPIQSKFSILPPSPVSSGDASDDQSLSGGGRP